MNQPNHPAWVDNQVPIGSAVETVYSGRSGTWASIGSYVFENITLDRPAKTVDRTNEIGQDNGWVLVRKVISTGSAVMQISTAATNVPRAGDYFQDVFTGGTADSSAPETWVLTSVGQPFSHDTYFKVNVNLRLSRSPATAPSTGSDATAQ